MRLQQIAPRCASGSSSACLLFRQRLPPHSRSDSWPPQPPPLTRAAPVHTQEGMHHPCPLLHAVRAGCAPGTLHVLKPVVGRQAIMHRSSDAALRKASPPCLGCTNRWVYRLLLAVCSQHSRPATLCPFSSKWATSARFNRSTMAASTAAASSYPCSSTVIQTNPRTSSSLLQRHLTHRQLGDQHPHDCTLPITSAGYTLRCASM